MNDALSSESKALLAAARAAEPRPTAADKARVKALVAAGIAGFPGVAEAASAGAKSAGGGAAGASLGLKIGGLLLAAGVGVTAYLSLSGPGPERSEGPRAGPPPRIERPREREDADAKGDPGPGRGSARELEQKVSVDPQVPVTRGEPPEPAPVRSVRRKAPPTVKTKEAESQRRPRPSPAARLAEEAALIKAAKKALASGQPEEALERLARHEKRFPAGELRTERRAVQAMALCQAGRVAEGRAILDALDPDAPYRAGIERACEVGPE